MKWGMALTAKIAGIKSVYTFHNCFKNPKLTKPYQKWLRWSAKNILKCKFQSISDSVYENELNFYGNITTKIYNWYDNNRFYPAEPNEKIHIRKNLNIPEEALVLISIGGCSHIKRHTDIIKILPEIKQNFCNRPVIYLHLGEGDDIENEKKLAEELGVIESVRFEGNRQNVRDFLIASDYYLMPSKHEGIPITTIETMACKIPTILYNVPGLRDFNSESLSSILIDEKPEEILHAIQRLEKDQALKQEMTENAFSQVTSKYYLPNNVKQIYKLYQS